MKGINFDGQDDRLDDKTMKYISELVDSSEPHSNQERRIMRDIKFRAWVAEEMRYSPSIGEWDCEDCDLFASYNKKPTILMQFTGLKDKNGKELYEGDIITDNSSTFEIVFEFAKWSFKRISGSYQFPSEYSNAKRFEIIGNIYENPELLKGQP